MAGLWARARALGERLIATTDGASGADYIGATAIAGVTGATVQAIMEWVAARLQATTNGASGADFVGATAITGWTGATVQAILESAKAYVDAHAKIAFSHLFAGDQTSTIAAYVIGIATGAGTVTSAGFHCAEGGADGTDALTLEGDILINGTSVFSTKPARTKAAADGLGTWVAATGITVGVLDATKVTVALGDVVTFVGTLDRTTPEDEVADVTAFCEITYA
jgi:hypothetical protein